MASLHKQKGKPNWFCAFTTADGKRHFKSTGTDEKKAAWEICQSWAGAALHGDGLTADKARELITRGVETVMLATGQALEHASIRDWCKRWLATKEVEAEERTHERYELAIRNFLAFLGPKANRRLEHLTADDVIKFRDHDSKTLSVASVNMNLRVIRAAMNAAFRQGLVQHNVVSRVSSMKEKGESKRRALTAAEIQKVLTTCGDSPWRGLVLLGLYTGQRLGDVARLTWQQVDLVKQEIWFVTRKTGQRLAMRIAEPLLQYLTSLPAGDDVKAYVLPRFAELADRSSLLSQAFANEVLIPAGMMPPRDPDKKSEGKGRTGKRQVNEVSFHSLRHSFVTMLKATGASESMAMAIVGHRSPLISKRYTHLSAKDTAESIAKLPDLTAPEAAAPKK